jgi:hypothetical protein
MFRPAEHILNTVLQTSTPSEKKPKVLDWRSEPRKSQAERFCCALYARVTRQDMENLRLIASQRGESLAETIRSMIAREAKVVLKGQSDAQLRSSRNENEGALAIFGAFLRNARRGH